MKIGGQIPWNAIPVCETFKISCLMGILHTRDVLGNHCKDRSFRLVHWLRITLFLRKTSQESINVERKSYLDCSLDTLCSRGEIWDEKNCLRTSGTENIHHDTGAPNTRKIKEIFLENQKGLFHHLKTHFWMPVKR